MISALSQSSIGQFYRCAEQFRRRWIEDDFIPPGIAAFIGTGAHKAAEYSNRAKLIGKPEPRSAVVAAGVEGYERACQKDGVYFSPVEYTEIQARKIIKKEVDTVAALAGLFNDQVAPTIQPVAVEERIEMMVPGLDIPMAGTIDWREADPAKWSDLKTSGKVWDQEKADAEIQPTLYPRLIEHLTGVRPTELKFNILVKTKEVKHQTLTTTRTDDDWRTLIQKARLMLAQIQAGIFPPADPAWWGCSPKWCGYWWSCGYISQHRKRLSNK